MMKIYQYMPGWTVACISPYVSKLANYLRMVGHPFEFVGYMAKLAEAPRAKLSERRRREHAHLPMCGIGHS